MPDDRHRNGRAPDDGFGDAAEQDARDAISAVAADDDVVELVLLGVLDDGPCRPADDRISVKTVAGSGGPVVGCFEHRLGAIFGGGEPVFGAPRPPRRRAVDRIHHVERGERVITELLEGVVERYVCRCRSVDGHEYVHVE